MSEAEVASVRNLLSHAMQATCLALAIPMAAGWCSEAIPTPQPLAAAPAPDSAPAAATAPADAKPAAPTTPILADDGRPQVRLLALYTDTAKTYRKWVPMFPVYPFTALRRWLKTHEDATHCALEWRDEAGNWFHGEMRSSNFDPTKVQYRVGGGQFPATGCSVYGIFIIPGRYPRDVDEKGRPMIVELDEEVPVKSADVDRELRNYGAQYATPGAPGTGEGRGRKNVGLGGPAYKPAQNSNTCIWYVLRAAGLDRESPPRAVGWGREPRFPYSTNVEMPGLDSAPY